MITQGHSILKTTTFGLPVKNSMFATLAFFTKAYVGSPARHQRTSSTGPIRFNLDLDGKLLQHLYTNQIDPYAHVPHIYLGLPTRGGTDFRRTFLKAFIRLGVDLENRTSRANMLPAALSRPENGSYRFTSNIRWISYHLPATVHTAVRRFCFGIWLVPRRRTGDQTFSV